MESLEFLRIKGLLDSTFRPIKPKGPINIVQNGVIFQQFCRNGLSYDIAISWLQKAIRRGLTEQALYCAYHIADLGKIFRSHLLNRLITILSEDIGPAEFGLTPMVEKLYFEAKEDTSVEGSDQTHENIVTMISLLSNARKSRITDWIIHASPRLTDPPLQPPNLATSWEKLVQWACSISNTPAEDYVEIGSTRKKLAVYQLWKDMLDSVKGKSEEQELKSLLNIYVERGYEYGLLHLVHAIAVLEFKSLVPHKPTPSKIPSWAEISKYDFPVLDAAVDIHTFYGRKHLGRTMYDFMKHGSVLIPWTPIGPEREIVQQLTEQYQPAEFLTYVPRIYQGRIINKALSYFTGGSAPNKGWLLMACGTGKTRTSYWITHGLITSRPSVVIVVVTPYLEILRQFFACYSEMNQTSKKESITGIVASCTDEFQKGECTNYEYITTRKQIKTFMEYDIPVKYLFTTYSSIRKLVGFVHPTVVIYDEAHHVKPSHQFDEGYELYLTATPKRKAASAMDVIAKYDLRCAIDDGYLTPYQITVLEEEMTVLEQLHHISKDNKKTIVFCRTNDIAKKCYEDWKSIDSDNAFYVDCHVPKQERDETLSKFREAERAIIFNCAILGEGVDFTDCDSIFIHSGYTSETRVVQAVGRPLRIETGKMLANIYMIDDGKVNKRLNHLRRYDPAVDQFVEWL